MSEQETIYTKYQAKWWILENIATLICSTALVLGLFYISQSWHSLWGLLPLLNLNSVNIRHINDTTGEDSE
jgi:hypothetical protein